MADTSRDCVIFDIDGTIADNSHRHHHLQKSPKDWDAFNAAMDADLPHPVIVHLLRLMHTHLPVLLCTGRQDCDREVTLNWLVQHDIPCTELHMRATNDFRPDSEVKKELLNHMRSLGWNPLFVVDDRNSVVKMWRDQGLVCFQCAEGDF